MTYRFLGLDFIISSGISRLDKTWPSGAQLLRKLALYRARARQRQQLYRLSDRQLEDIGLSRCEARQEANKPFWLD